MIAALPRGRHLATASVASTAATRAARYCRLFHSKENVLGQFPAGKRCRAIDNNGSGYYYYYYYYYHRRASSSLSFSSSSSPSSTSLPAPAPARPLSSAQAPVAAAATSAPTAKLALSTPPSSNAIGYDDAHARSPPLPPRPESSSSPLSPPLTRPPPRKYSSSLLTSTPPNNFFPQNSQSSLTAAAQAPLERTRLLASHFSTSALFSSSSSSHSDSSSIMTSLPISEKGYHGKAPAVYTTRKHGAPNTLEHRIWIEKDGVPLSPFHDIPLYANEQQTVLNMIVEVPRWTNAKMEISKEETLNPIKQDIKKGKLRYVRNCFPHKGYLWNYGAFPQTWEDPSATHPETKANGDNDPLDVCEIGELVAKPGEIKQVKVLGVMALLDEGETDWKIIVIDVNDPLAPKLNDIEDVERHLPGLLRATNEWFRIYKIPDGKPENQFAFSGECKNRKYATDIIRECAEAWERLATGKTQPGDISLANTSVANSPHRTDPAKLNIPKNETLAPAPIDPSIDKWFYISGQSS